MNPLPALEINSVISPPLIVLKFGSSVLADEADVDRVIQEIYRWRRSGFQVVAVVSAIGDTTDRLVREATTTETVASEKATAQLLATGEWQSAAMVGMALDKFGISHAILDEVQLGLRTTGPTLDATLEQIDLAVLYAALDQSGVVIVPGFIGRDVGGQTTLLGRGGSDLTALFIAARSRAKRCRLIKDVDGLYPRDPQATQDQPSPQRFERLTFEHALTLDESIVQHKAIRFAQKERCSFEVAALASIESTQVGDFAENVLSSDTFASYIDRKDPARRSRVALLGLGTVGLGVYRQLVGPFRDQFQIVGIAVANPEKAIRQGVPAESVTSDTETVIASDCDVVVEVVGGVELPRDWIETALRQGKDVVTANKALLASDLDRLQGLAHQKGCRLFYSAAVGGAVPVLETILALGDANPIVGVQAILNGSTNFILDRLQQGDSLEQAVDRAHRLGLTERDPRRDLDGLDAAEKLVLIARACNRSLRLDQIQRQALTGELAHSIRSGGETIVRQIARLELDDDTARGSVRYESLTSAHPLASVCGAQNRIELEWSDGSRLGIHGLGAGRWPTTTAILADLLQSRCPDHWHHSLQLMSGNDLRRRFDQ